MYTLPTIYLKKSLTLYKTNITLLARILPNYKKSQCPINNIRSNT